MADSEWKKLGSEYILENPWFKVRRDNVVRPGGKQDVYNVIEFATTVFVIPVTAEDTIVLVKLFRYATQHEGWEVPAGAVDPGEKLVGAAKRELQEETGLEGGSWRQIGRFDSMNGSTDAMAHVFEATNLNPTGHNEQAEEGITATQAFSFDEVAAMVLNGGIADGLSIAALMQFFASRKMLITPGK